LEGHPILYGTYIVNKKEKSVLVAEMDEFRGFGQRDHDTALKVSRQTGRVGKKYPVSVPLASRVEFAHFQGAKS
jgi:hypothetical protein